MKKVRSKLRPTEIGVIKTFSLSPDDEVGEIAVQCSSCTYYYNNLAELCEKWEDVPEEPKEHWAIDQFGEPINVSGLSRLQLEKLHRIGNDFPSEDATMKAIEKLKAWKRLKENGFKFGGWKLSKRYWGDYIIEAQDYTTCDGKDLTLLFGGEE